MIREPEDLPVTIVLRATAENLGKSKLGALPSPLMGSGFLFLATRFQRVRYSSEGIQMEKLHCILHSHGRSAR